MLESVLSKNEIQIRLTLERWLHITETHSEMAGYYYEILETISDPDAIYEGSNNEYIAIKRLIGEKHIFIIYKEVSETDGFIITAFLSKKINSLRNRRVIWNKL